ncbi:GIY-YIG nuclease family protein [Asinibacterium sp. OR53]|uniref:GIY-YIG nuclease family protein n=1 Tax=Asinibacterium sp. OR53 TaxID=925409 RepID=UPI00047B5D17|nr:GIY-YIG nuclease family protein [Asinibacterium sp. OR53]
METFGKNIRIYLKDGTVTGIKFGEVVNHTIQAVSFPRSRASEIGNYAEARKPGVYFLLGIDEDTNEPMVYIGEAENVFDRLQNHIANKDFWNEVIFFVGKDENLTKSHVKYLESRLINIAFSTKRYKVGNSNQPQQSSLPMADRDAMEEFLTFMRLLLGVFGHKLMEDVTPQSKKQLMESLASPSVITKPQQVNDGYLELSLSVSGLKASAIQTDEGIVVLKGSEAAKEPTNGLQAGYAALRDRLIKNGVLVLIGSKYIFQSDHLFDAASPAAAVIVGYNINGRHNWRDINGKSLKEIEKEKLLSAV